MAHVLSPGDVVVMDNLSTHKVVDVQHAIASASASILYLLLYNPDLNPIEQVFAKLKALFRKAVARTREVLWTTIAILLDAFSRAEYQDYLENSGYDFD